MPMNDVDSRERLIRMEAKLDSHLYRTTQNESRLDGHDGRIRDLEKGHSKTLGVATGVSAVIATLGAYLARLIH